MKSFDCGDADVVIISADSDVESERLARWKCITLNPQSFSIDNGIVDVKTVEKNPQHQKVLWKGSDNQSLVLHFIHQLCGQRA